MKILMITFICCKNTVIKFGMYPFAAIKSNSVDNSINITDNNISEY